MSCQVRVPSELLCLLSTHAHIGQRLNELPSERVEVHGPRELSLIEELFPARGIFCGAIGVERFRWQGLVRTRIAEARGMTFLARSIAASIHRFSLATGTRLRPSLNPESRSRTRTRRRTAVSIDTRHSSIATRSRSSASVSPSSSRTTTSPSPR